MTSPPVGPGHVAGCFSCDVDRRPDSSPRERVWVSTHWRVAHAFNSALPGWLVMLPRRHVTAIAELGPAEAAELGPLLADLSRALGVVTGCVKTYVLALAEAEGFSHVHFHVVPRAAEMPDDIRGPRVFSLLGGPVGEWVADDEQDRLALALALALAAEPVRR